MSISQKFISFISGCLMIVFGILMLTLEEDGYEAVLLILETALMLSGIQQLFYYFTMARNMVGGIYIFYKGILLLDAGLFALNLDKVPEQYGMLYLIATI